MEQESPQNFEENLEEEGSFRPDFIRDFSKETGQDLRDQKAKEIWEARSNRRQETQEMADEIEVNQKKVDELKGKVMRIDNAFWAKLPFFDKLSDKLTQEDKVEIARLDSQIEEAISSPHLATKEPHQVLEEFYQKEEERWREAEFSREDVDRYFSEEYLSSLSLPDFLLLCSRFNTEFATHVTRQGVRDHIAMREHSAGQGEFQHGFEDILEDKRLKAIYGDILMQEDKEKALADHLAWLIGQMNALGNNYNNESDREILEKYIENTKMKGMWSGSYSDSVAVHMGLKAVLDNYYGGEQGNEFFFLVPMAHIMKEYKTAYVGPPTVDFNNNLWIWDKEHKGVSINAGIACIPELTPVDPRNGSSYELDENNEPIVNQENLEVLTGLCSSGDFIAFQKEAIRAIWEAGKKYQGFDVKQKYSEELKNRFGVNDPRVIDLLLSDSGIQIHIENQFQGRSIHKTEPRVMAEAILSENACLFTRAKNTVSSREYWENYFKQYPELKPNKVFYYRGSPNWAVGQLRNKHKLESYNRKPRGEEFFPESRISIDEREEISPSYDEFFALAQRVLDKYFPENEKQKEEQLI